MTEVQVADERGKTWLVYKGDAAWRQCQFLFKVGVAEVVLPRETLLQSALPSLYSIDIPEVPLESVRLSADVRAVVYRLIRLKDCVQWLAMNALAN